MNNAKDIDGLDALLNGNDGIIGSLNNLYYYAPANSQQTVQDVSRGVSLENMVGLAAIVYDNANNGALPPKQAFIKVNGVTYTVIDEEDDPSGYQGLTLYDSASKAIIVVNRGTEPASAKDWWTDIKMAITTINNQWSGAKDLASRVPALAAKYGATAIYTTGHSLGGTLTEMQAAYFGWTGYTFNAYGAGEVYNQLLQLNQVPPISPSAQIYNYRTMFDLVSDASTHIGNPMNTIETPQDVALLGSFYDFLNPTQSLAYDFLSTVLKDHFIANFHGANDPEGDLLGSGDNVYTLVPAMTAPPPPSQLIAIAADIISSMAELIHLGLEAIPNVGPFQSGNLSLQQSAEEVWQFINNEPVSGIKTILPSDPSLLSHALDPAAANNAYRASLASLSPMVLQGLDPGSFINATLWAPGQTTGLTKDYLVARNDMIQAMLTIAGGGQAGSGLINTSNANSYVYTDISRSSSPLYTLNGQGGSTYDVVFAGDNGHGLTVSPGAYAELFGGAGDDTLFGGNVGSTLQGGAGNDDYIIDGTGTGVDYILDTDGQGVIEWKAADGSTKVLTGGDDQIGTSVWKSADGSITYAEDLGVDGATELEIQSGNKIVYVDDFTNGEFGINLTFNSSQPAGTTNLSGLTAITYADHTEYQDLSGAGPNNLDDIYGVTTTGSSYNIIEGEGNAGYIYAGDGNNDVFANDLRYSPVAWEFDNPINVTIQGGSGNQLLVGMGNGDETIIGGDMGQDTTAWDTIDGGGANALLTGGSQNSLIFGGTGTDTITAGSASSGSGLPEPITVALAGLSFWASSTQTAQGGGSVMVSGEPEVGIPAFTDPADFQIDLALSQLDGSYASPIGLLGSSLDSGLEDGSTTLPGSLLIGGTGLDYLIGNGGNDTVMGGTPAHPVAGVLDEVLLGGAGADLIYGGGGTEIIFADMSPGAVSNWADLDPTVADTIYGGSGNEYIYGSGGNDVIHGGSGNYTIYTGNGNSYVETGAGNSVVYGGNGDDTIVANGAQDSIDTGGGNTYVQLVSGDSTITAGAGDDVIEADGGSAHISGGSGHLTLVAGTNTGSDTVQPGSGGLIVQLTGGLSESTLVVRNVNGDLVLSDPGFDTNVSIQGYFSDSPEVSLQFADGVAWSASQILQASMTPRSDGGNDTLVGSEGNDNIVAGYGDTSIIDASGSNTLTGGAGDDTIKGGSGADTIEGGSGTTQILGGTGNEAYVFNVGDGSDTITESASSATGTDRLLLGSGIDPSDVTLSHVGSTNNVSTNDLLITFGPASSSTITLANFFTADVNQRQISVFEFADGTTLTRDQLLEDVRPISGATGSDTLYGSSGADIIDGKGGDDVYVGNGGNDTFVFNAGYGHLQINEAYLTGQQSILQLGAGITASELHVTTDGINLLLTDGVSGDQVALLGMSYSSSGIQEVQLADGTELTRDQLVQMSHEIVGTSSNDALTGTPGADYFDGLGGNDTETGNGGQDTFVFNAGYGQLTIYGSESYHPNMPSSIVKLGEGINESALHVTSNDRDFLLTDGISGDQITLDRTYDALLDNYTGLTEVQLADGTMLTASQLLQMEISGGTTGDDSLYGSYSAEYFDGKGGADFERGVGGSDTFVFDAGYGRLTIDEGYYRAGQQSVLLLGEGIDASTLDVTEDMSRDLILTDGISGDQITIWSPWTSGSYTYLNGTSGPEAWGVQQVQFADGTSLTRDQLFQKASNLDGTIGNDTLIGTLGADLIDGQGGEDGAIGNGGNDTFVFNAGYGILEISEFYTTGQAPVLKLGVGITESNLRATSTGYGLGGYPIELTDGITGDQITLYGMFTDSYSSGVASVQFADGSSLTPDMLVQMVESGKTAAQVLPIPNVDSITGSTGNDSLQGTAGADYFDGRGGDDTEQGAGGNDTFVFNPGYGHLEIKEQYSSQYTSVLQLGAGISDLRVTTDGTSLLLSDGIDTDQVILDGAFSSDDPGATTEVQFAGGWVLTGTQLNGMALRMINGTTGSDTLIGASSAELFDGKGGNDSVEGNGGNDVFVFDAGYGHLEINEQYSNGQAPILQLGVGIGVSDLLVRTNGTNLYLTDGINGDQVTLDNAFSDSSASGVAKVELADGTILSAAQIVAMAPAPINGTMGDDTLAGTSASDLIDGKGGNDSVQGGGGNDTFVFNAGYGELEISEHYSNGQTPVLQLGEGISATALQVAPNASGSGLVLTDGTSGDRITLDNMLFDDSTYGVQEVQFADGTTLTEAQLIQMESGAPGNGGSITGGSGDDTLVASGANESLIGGTGTEVFDFKMGFGQDTLLADGAAVANTILFGAGITASDLSFSTDGSELLITATNSTGDDGQASSIALPDHFVDGEPVTDVGELVFDDGSYVPMAQIDQLFAASPPAPPPTTILTAGADDTLASDNGEDLLKANAGNDTLWGGSGTDTLESGVGNSLMVGGTGAETYLFDLGFGQDSVVANAAATSNTILFSAGITVSDLSFSTDGSELLIIATNSIGGDGQASSITLADHFVNGTPVTDVGELVFDDGSYVTMAQIDQLFAASPPAPPPTTILTAGADDTLASDNGDDLLKANADNDTLWGGSGTDTLESGVGNSLLVGGTGAETYLFDLGFGQDSVVANAAATSNTILFSAGITVSDLSFSTDGSELLITATNSTGGDGQASSITLADHFVDGTPVTDVGELVFNDGSYVTMAQIDQLFEGSQATTESTSTVAAVDSPSTTSHADIAISPSDAGASTQNQHGTLDGGNLSSDSEHPMGTGSITVQQLNSLIHAMASYTGGGSGSESSFSISPTTTGDLMLHVAA